MTTGPSPSEEYSATVRPEWIDDNGHMNLAYYVLVFDGATDLICEAVSLVQPAGRTAPIWAYLMRQGASLSWST